MSVLKSRGKEGIGMVRKGGIRMNRDGQQGRDRKALGWSLVRKRGNEGLQSGRSERGDRKESGWSGRGG